MKKYINRQENGVCVINEGFFDFLKVLVTGKSGVSKIPDKDLSEKGKEIRTMIKGFQSSLAKSAKEAGMTEDEYVKSLGFTF